jgi:hypothetical protein
MHDHRLRMRHLVAQQHLGEEHLVRALQDRIRIVDDDQSLRLRLLREPIGAVIHAGGLAQEQRFELTESCEVVGIDEVDVEPDGLTGLLELLQRALVARRILGTGVAQDREVVARVGALARGAMPAREVLARDVEQERAVLDRHFDVADEADAGHAPAPGLRMALELRAQQRRRELPKQRGGELVVALRDVATEVDAERELVRLDRRQALLDQIFEFARHDADHGRRLQLLDGRDARARLVPARFGEQRHVVAGLLIPIRAAEVEHARSRQLHVRGIGQVVLRRDDARVRHVERPIRRIADDDEIRRTSVHDAREFSRLGRTTKSTASYVSTPSRIDPMTRSMSTS